MCNASGASAQFIFLPGVPIQLGTLLPVLMGADALGALLGWRYLDHLGHLGGAIFGGPWLLFCYAVTSLLHAPEVPRCGAALGGLSV